jgi:hypothetical protein
MKCISVTVAALLLLMQLHTSAQLRAENLQLLLSNEKKTDLAGVRNTIGVKKIYRLLGFEPVWIRGEAGEKKLAGLYSLLNGSYHRARSKDYSKKQNPPLLNIFSSKKNYSFYSNACWSPGLRSRSSVR